MWFQQIDQFGLSAAMDLAIVERALGEIDNLPSGYLAVNLSVHSLASAGELCDLLIPAAERRRIVIELTEHAVVQDYVVVERQLRPLRDAGILLAVDDAGAGYSTFQHVLRLRPDIIKLDKSITERIDEDPARRALTTALVIFAGEINASVVAEGIETESELAAVRAAGVSRGQGFGLARPQLLPLAPLDYEPAPDINLADAGLVSAQEFAEWGGVGAGSDATMAVVAHGLLSSLGSVESALKLLQATDRRMEPEQYRALCSVMQRQVAHVSDVLRDLVRGLSPEAIRKLEQISVAHGGR